MRLLVSILVATAVACLAQQKESFKPSTGFRVSRGTFAPPKNEFRPERGTFRPSVDFRTERGVFSTGRFPAVERKTPSPKQIRVIGADETRSFPVGGAR